MFSIGCRTMGNSTGRRKIRRNIALLFAFALASTFVTPPPATRAELARIPSSQSRQTMLVPWLSDVPYGPAYSVRAVSRLSAYDTRVLADKPSAYWKMSGAKSGPEPDMSHSGLSAKYVGTPAVTMMPNGDMASDFYKAKQYLQVADAAVLSPATTGVLTIEAWMRPDTLDFKYAEGLDRAHNYVHWMGKGTPGKHEYVSRIYSAHNTDARPNRVSGYLYNTPGGLGAGSYFQDVTTVGKWIHYVFVINSKSKSIKFPHGYTKIYKNGVLRAQDDLSIRGQVIEPKRSDAPFRVGTRDLKSFFTGAVGKVAIYGHELSKSTIDQHFRAMQPGPA